jgi:outer membrane protein W
MKQRAMWLSLLAFVLGSAVSTHAQGKYEITPFVGFESSGNYPVTTASGVNNSIDQLRVNQATAFGTFFDYNVTENFQGEFLWDHNNTSYSARQALSQTYYKAFDTNVDQFQFGANYMFLDSTHKLRPYAAASLGFTHEANSGGNSNRTAFSWSIGGGVKYYLSPHFGLRGDVRYLPTYGNSSYGTYCDPIYGFCYPANVSNWLNRANIVGGLIFHF